MSKQGDLNEYRIGKAEDDIRHIKEVTDWFKGAWWAVCGAFAIFVAMCALIMKFLGKYIAVAMVEHYAARAGLPATITLAAAREVPPPPPA